MTTTERGWAGTRSAPGYRGGCYVPEATPPARVWTDADVSAYTAGVRRAVVANRATATRERRKEGQCW